MSASQSDFVDREEQPASAEALALDLARWLCGGQVGPLPEVMAPDVEAEATDAFRRLADALEAIAAARRGGRAA
jgi:hypothetical protein